MNGSWTPGLPPEGDGALYLGQSLKDKGPFILFWVKATDDAGAWAAIGLEPSTGHRGPWQPIVRLCREENADFIASYLPWA
jgi:hypothetical protein